MATTVLGWLVGLTIFAAAFGGLVKAKWLFPFVVPFMTFLRPRQPADIEVRVMVVIGVFLLSAIWLVIIKPWRPDPHQARRDG